MGCAAENHAITYAWLIPGTHNILPCVGLQFMAIIFDWLFVCSGVIYYDKWTGIWQLPVCRRGLLVVVHRKAVGGNRVCSHIFLVTMVTRTILLKLDILTVGKTFVPQTEVTWHDWTQYISLEDGMEWVNFILNAFWVFVTTRGEVEHLVSRLIYRHFMSSLVPRLSDLFNIHEKGSGSLKKILLLSFKLSISAYRVWALVHWGRSLRWVPHHRQLPYPPHPPVGVVQAS